MSRVFCETWDSTDSSPESLETTRFGKAAPSVAPQALEKRNRTRHDCSDTTQKQPPQTHAAPWKSGASAPRNALEKEPGFSPWGRLVGRTAVCRRHHKPRLPHPSRTLRRRGIPRTYLSERLVAPASGKAATSALVHALSPTKNPVIPSEERSSATADALSQSRNLLLVDATTNQGCPILRAFCEGIPRTRPSRIRKRHDREGHDFSRAATAQET